MDIRIPLRVWTARNFVTVEDVYMLIPVPHRYNSKLCIRGIFESNEDLVNVATCNAYHIAAVLDRSIFPVDPATQRADDIPSRNTRRNQTFDSCYPAVRRLRGLFHTPG